MKITTVFIFLIVCLGFFSQEYYPKKVESTIEDINGLGKLLRVEFRKLEEFKVDSISPYIVYSFSYDNERRLINSDKLVRTYRYIEKTVYKSDFEYDLYRDYKLSEWVRNVYDSNKKIIKRKYECYEIDSYHETYINELGMDTLLIACVDNDCEKVWSKMYNSLNQLIKYQVYAYDDSIVFKEVFGYDSLNRIINTNKLIYDLSGTDLYGLEGNELVDYDFLTTKEVIKRRVINYNTEFIEIKYYDFNKNESIKKYSLDKYGNVLKCKELFKGNEVLIFQRKYSYDKKFVTEYRFSNNKATESVKYFFSNEN